MTENKKFPPEVAKAIIKVMGNVKRLVKTEKNQFARYDFAGIDKFLEAVNPLCYDAGLVIIQNETSKEIITTTKDGSKHSNWLALSFDFWLVHESGTCIESPIRRTVMVPAEGAQAFGSAQSYALKQFMRSLFMIPTGGTEDADFRKATELPESTGKKSAYRARKDGDYEAITAEIAMCSTEEGLRKWGEDNRDRIHVLPDKWQEHIADVYQARKSVLQQYNEHVEQ